MLMLVSFREFASGILTVWSACGIIVLTDWLAWREGWYWVISKTSV